MSGAFVDIYLMDAHPFPGPWWSVAQPDGEWTAVAVTGGVLVAGGRSTIQTFDLRMNEGGTEGVPSALVDVPAQAPIKRLIARGRYVYVLTGDLRLSVVDLHCEMP